MHSALAPHWPPYLQVVTTVGEEEQARRIAAELIERRLAACVQVAGPVTSCYRWQEQVETSQEWTLTIKTRGELYPRLEAAIAELHSYEVPEILALPILTGSAPYVAWLDEQVAAPQT